MKPELRIVPEARHNQLVRQAFLARGYQPDEADHYVCICSEASRHGVQSHNALKALHLDDLFGTVPGGCHPGAEIETIPNRFKATQVWDAHFKPGPSVAYQAFETAIQLADDYGIGAVFVDNGCHYLWGGGYVIDVANRGYLAFTQCTAMLAEVVPFGGRHPTLGTNPHTWGLPTTPIFGYPVIVDWATSAIAMGKVQQLKREKRPLPPAAAVDASGQVTADPEKVAALLPFGQHKGYGLGLINEIIAAMIGGSLPTVRGHFPDDDEKHVSCHLYLVVHPEAINTHRFARGRSQEENLRSVMEDIFGHGNESSKKPGQLEWEAAERSRQAGGLLFSEAEINAFSKLAEELNQSPWPIDDFPLFTA